MYTEYSELSLVVSGDPVRTINNDGTHKYREGTDGNDRFISKIGDTMEGRRGDDTYNIWHENFSIIERPGEGVDTVVALFAGSIILPDNVENLILSGKGMVAGTGNALDNVIWAGETGATLDGRQGDDVLVGGAGADVFKVASGNGSDAILNFQVGRDVITLEGYGLTSFAHLVSLGQQVGDDVVFTFANQERLVVTDVSMGDLNSFDFGFAVDKPPVDEGQTYMDGHRRAQNWNGWYIINNSYGVGSLKPGIDFNIDATFDKYDATGGTTFTWTMPYTTQKGSPILAYPEVAFGVPPKGANEYNPGDKAAVFPVQVSDLVSLTADFDVDWTGNAAGFNVAYDIWLTSEPFGDRSTITAEVMVWVHKGEVEVFAPVVGTYQDGDVTYTIYHKGTYIALVADRDVRSGVLDVTDILDTLASLGIVSRNDYLAAIELGAEVVSGVGSLTINNLDLTVKSRGEDGSVIVKEVTGSGQNVYVETPDTQTPDPVPEMPHPIGETPDDPIVETPDPVEEAPDPIGETPGPITETPAPPVEETSPPPPPSLLQTLFVNGTSKLTNAEGLVVGKTVTVVEPEVVTERFYSDKGALLSFDRIVATGNGDISRRHFSTKGVFAGAEVEQAAGANGSVNTLYYDALWKLTGAQNTLVKANGDTQILHYDASWTLMGADVVIERADGRVATQHYSSSWTYLGQEVKVIEPNGAISIQHYDATHKFVGQDSTFIRADGSTATYHYDAAWQKVGFDVARAGSDGVVTTLVHDGGGTLLSTEYAGTTGADTIRGSSGPNVFKGGLGSDTLHGGAGADAFVFDTAIGRGDVDTIRGFSSGQDKIVLDQEVFADVSPGVLSEDAFHVGAQAQDAADRIIYNEQTGSLFYDADGTGAEQAIEFARLDPNTALKASDIVAVLGDQGIWDAIGSGRPGEWFELGFELVNQNFTIA